MKCTPLIFENAKLFLIRLEAKFIKLTKNVPYDFLINANTIKVLIDSSHSETGGIGKKMMKKSLKGLYEKFFKGQIPIKESLLINNSEKVNFLIKKVILSVVD